MEYFYLKVISIVIVITYLCWGFAFALQSLLILRGTKNAIKWAKNWYSPKVFFYELIIFSPIIYIFYLLFELFPSILLLDDNIVKFDINKIFDIVFKNY